MANCAPGRRRPVARNMKMSRENTRTHVIWAARQPHHNRRAFVTTLLFGCWMPFAGAAQNDADTHDTQGNAVAENDASTPASGASQALDIDTILNNPLDDEAYQQRRSCVLLRSIDHVEILNDSLVLFHVRRNKAWLNKLSSRCVGLDSNMIVSLRVHGSSICRLDTFQGRERASSFGMEANCRLGDFEAIDGMQIDALKAALEERRAAADVARKMRRAERRAAKESKR